MPAAIGALEVGSGCADKTVALGVVLLIPAVIAVVVIGVGISRSEWCGCNRARGIDCASGDASRGSDRRARNISRPIGAVLMTALIIGVDPIGAGWDAEDGTLLDGRA
jgi:hypothetical protein